MSRYDEDEEELPEEEKQKLALELFNNQQLQLAYNAQEPKGFFKKHWVYETPWFLLLGDDDNSTERFDAFSIDAFHKSPADQLIQWAFTPSATLLNVKNNLWNHQDDVHQSLWLDVNHWILEKRNKRPVNGIILDLDVEQLIRKDNAENPDLNTIKTKLVALNRTFGNEVPVYLTISQCHKLDGFEAYRKTLSDDELSSPFGFSLSFNQEGQDAGFTEQFKALENTLNTSLIRNTSTSGIEENRQAYVFIREFIGLKDTLYALVDTLSAGTLVSDQLIVRGLYFTANKASTENSLQAIPSTVNARYDLPHQVPQTTTKKRKNSHLYFSQQLLKAVLLPESGLAADNCQHIEKRRHRILATYVITGILIVLFCAAWLYFYKKNQYIANQSIDLIQGYQALEQFSVENKSAEPLHLQTLDLLRDAITQNQEKSFMPLALRDMGMDVKPVIKGEEEKAYRRMLSNDFLPALIEQQMRQLEKRVGNKQAKLHDDDIEQLKVIRLLTIHTDELDQGQKDKISTYRQQLVFPWMETYWKQHYQNYDQIEGSLRRHLNYVLNNNIQSRSDPQMIERVSALQNHEQDLPTDEKVYQQIKKQITENNPTALNLQHQLGTAFFQVFEQSPNNGKTSPLVIPYLYTQQGFAAYKAVDYQKLLQSFSFDAWALGKNNHLQNYSELDILQLKKQVKEHYISEYESAWLNAINSLNIRHFRTPQEALVFLKALAGKDSPYKKFLLLVQENTVLPLPKAKVPPKESNQDDNKEGNNNKEATPDADTLTDEQEIEKDIALSLKASFEFINELSEKGDDGKSYMSDVFKTLATLQKNIKQLASPKKKPAKAPAKASPEADPIETLLDVSGTVSEPFQSQFQQIALDSQALITQHTTADINHDWAQIIYPFYAEKLKGKYPLAKAGQDVSMDDFKAFFGKNGLLDKFYTKHLSPVYGDKSAEETFLQASPVLEMYQHAQFIQQAFFNDAGEFQVELTIEPTVLSNIFINSVLNLEGTQIPYQHEETKPLSLVWPSQTKDKNKSSLTLNPIEKNAKNSYVAIEGEWAFFRLIDQSKTHALKDQERIIRFKQGGGVAGYKLTVPKSISPLTKDVFAGFDIPPTLFIPSH
jgi:type VI secretion system protein ImpL